jgi:hypothetical protein
VDHEPPERTLRDPVGCAGGVPQPWPEREAGTIARHLAGAPTGQPCPRRYRNHVYTCIRLQVSKHPESAQKLGRQNNPPGSTTQTSPGQHWENPGQAEEIGRQHVPEGQVAGVQQSEFAVQEVPGLRQGGGLPVEA